MSERLLTPADVAEHLGCSVRAAQERMRAHPACVRVGRLLRLPPAALREWIAPPAAIQSYDIVEPPVIAGCYLLIWRGEVRYVGQSTDVHMRVRAHRNMKRFYFSQVRVFELASPSAAALDSAERCLIDALRPPMNGNAGPSCDPAARPVWEAHLGIATARGVEALLRWLLE